MSAPLSIFVQSPNESNRVRGHIWLGDRDRVFSSTSGPQRDIEMTEEKVQAIKAAMEKFKLPSMPPWAAEISDKDWSSVVQKDINKK